MPIIEVDVDGVDRTVTRPVIMDVIYDLINAMGIPLNTRVMYPGSAEAEDIQIGVNDGVEEDDTYDPRMKVTIEAEENFVPEHTNSMVTDPNENKPIFLDEALGVILSPIYARTEVELSIQFRFPDKNLAEKKMHDIRRYSSRHRDGLFHEVKYRYLVPKPNLAVLAEIHRLRESQAGYGEDLQTWLRSGFDEQITTLTNRNDSYRSLAVDEIQTGIMGFYTFDVVPDPPEATETKGTHTLQVDYRFSYDKVLSTIMQYPLIVHNQPLDSDYYDDSVPFELGHRLQMPNRTRAYMDPFTRNQIVTGFPMGAPIPAINDWIPPSTPSHTEGLLRIMTIVDPEDRRELLNFYQLGQLEIKERLLDYMKKEHANLTIPKRAVVFVGLYENNRLLGPEKIEVDKDLNLKTTFDMKLRNRYHVWVGMLVNLNHLADNSKQRLRKDGSLLDEVLIGIDDTLEERDKLPKRLSGDYVPKDELQKSIDAINTRREPINGTISYGNFRVGQFVIKV